MGSSVSFVLVTEQVSPAQRLISLFESDQVDSGFEKSCDPRQLLATHAS
jgi:hypothetical protein